MMKFKKMKSILAFSLPLIIAVLCVCTLSVKAAGTPLGNLAVEYFGQSVANAGPAATPVKRIPKFTVGDIVWIGVKADNLDKLVLFKAGVCGMELGFDYNSNYLEPYGDLTAAELTALGGSVTNADSAAWLATINKFNFGTGLVNDADKWDGSIYELSSGACNMKAESVADANREDYVPALGATAADYKMMFLSVQKKAGASQADATVNRFYNTTDATGKYLIKLPMRIKAVPVEPAPGWELKLSRGPQTFVVMSGADGTSQYAQWEKATSAGNLDEHNLKTLFGFAKDLELFGVAAPDEIASLEVRNIDGNADDTDDIKYDLHQGSFAGAVGFVDRVDEYYVRVPSKTDSVKLWMDSSSTPITVKYSDYVAAEAAVAITAPTDPAITWKTSAQALAVVDTAKNTGFNNTLTLTVGETAKIYKIHIQRLAEAKIELNYGNSPVGEIMKDDVTFTTNAAKETAINAFKANVNGRFKFSANASERPSTITKEMAALEYTTAAWKSYKDNNGQVINYDLDPNAMFAYAETQFRDSGFVVHDQFGAVVTNPNVTVTATLKQCKKDGFIEYTPEAVIDFAINQTNTLYDIVGHTIRPDVYKITYTYAYTDVDGVAQTLTIERPLIIISRRGDLNLTTLPVTNVLDANALKSNMVLIDAGNSLLAFRVADFTMDSNPVINTLDANELKSAMVVIDAGEQYYNELLNK